MMQVEYSVDIKHTLKQIYSAAVKMANLIPGKTNHVNTVMCRLSQF